MFSYRSARILTPGGGIVERKLFSTRPIFSLVFYANTLLSHTCLFRPFGLCRDYNKYYVTDTITQGRFQFTVRPAKMSNIPFARNVRIRPVYPHALHSRLLLGILER